MNWCECLCVFVCECYVMEFLGVNNGDDVNINVWGILVFCYIEED